MPKKIKKTTLTKKQAEKDLRDKLNMFDRLPEECTACQTPFDKQNRDMVKSWNVVVRTNEDAVRIYCPTCWETAISVVKTITEEE